jgi:hypothetical protein
MGDTLIGYVRKSKAGGALKVSLDLAAIDTAETFESKDGRKFVQGIINLDKAQQVIAGTREVTCMSHIHDEQSSDDN